MGAQTHTGLPQSVYENTNTLQVTLTFAFHLFVKSRSNQSSTVQLPPHPRSPSTLHRSSFVLHLSNDEPVCEGCQEWKSATADLPFASPPCLRGCVRMTALPLIIPPPIVAAFHSTRGAVRIIDPAAQNGFGCSALQTQQVPKTRTIMMFYSFEVEVYCRQLLISTP